MPLAATPVQAANPEPFFYISVLAPNTNPARNQWATMMVEQLPKIGIGIDTFDHTGWSGITPRTWDYPGPYPIPTYEEGGFDLMFVGWSWGLDWDPTGLYDTAGITPNGDNFYQYSSQAMDWAISNYTASFLLEDRLTYIKQIQAALYEDNPAICIIYPLSVYPMDTAFDQSSWDGLLWASTYQPMENWSCGEQTTFKYATPADFVDFHVLLYESVYDAQWLRQIYNGMLERSALEPYNRGYGPRLANSWDSEDGLLYNVEIKPDAVWADGTPLTVYDVNYTYNLVLTPTFGSSAYSFYSKYMDNDSIIWNPAVSNYTYQMQFKQQYVFQESNIGLDLVPKHIWEGVPYADHGTQAYSWATTTPENLFGAGPYRLEEYDSTNGIIHLTVNEHFADWADITPNFQDLYFIFYDNKEGALSDLAAGTIDMVDAQFVPQLDEIPAGTTYQLIEDPGTQEMGLNCLHPWLGTGENCPIATPESGKNIRAAINHLVPRDIIVEEIMNGLAAPGVTGCPNVAVGFDTTLQPYEYSIALAKEHMEAAGFVYETEVTGLGLFVVIGILGLIGASQVIFLKRRK
jgi:ABC-type transport system substrate-binding protein